MYKAAVEPVGLREKLSLELKGDVLICRGRSWAQNYTVYIPSECMSVESGHRRDGRLLIRGVLLPLILLFCGIFLLLLGAVLERLGLSIAPVFDAAFHYGLISAAVISLVYLAYCTLRFLPKRPTVRVRIESEEGTGMVEFWHEFGRDTDVDRLVNRLLELEKRSVDKMPFPLRMSYTWHHVRPARAAIVTGVGGTLILYVLAVIIRYVWEWLSGSTITLTPWFFSIFLIPWLWALGQYLLAFLSIRHEPEVFRLGIKHFDAGDFVLAERNFLRTLDIVPRHVPSLYLLVQLSAYRFDLDKAFKYCAQLAALAPEEAEALQQELWTLKRLVARMEA